jgi:hypothetical protein
MIESYLAKPQQGPLQPGETVALIGALNSTFGPTSRHGTEDAQRRKQMRDAWAGAYGDQRRRHFIAQTVEPLKTDLLRAYQQLSRLCVCSAHMPRALDNLLNRLPIRLSTSIREKLSTVRSAPISGADFESNTGAEVLSTVFEG